jgi:hypothetical protein
MATIRSAPCSSCGRKNKTQALARLSEHKWLEHRANAGLSKMGTSRNSRFLLVAAQLQFFEDRLRRFLVLTHA